MARMRFNRSSEPAMRSVVAVSPNTQGCSSISSAVIRLVGSRSMSRANNSLALSDKCCVTGELRIGGGYMLVRIRFSSSSSVAAPPLTSNGCTPFSMMYKMTPSAHMSAAGCGRCPMGNVKVSGDA
eukprot:scaffold10723_cov164-Amphora_coffeaeformis.AAC.8